MYNVQFHCSCGHQFKKIKKGEDERKKGQFPLNENGRFKTLHYIQTFTLLHITHGGTPNRLLGSPGMPFVQVVCFYVCMCTRACVRVCVYDTFPGFPLQSIIWMSHRFLYFLLQTSYRLIQTQAGWNVKAAIQVNRPKWKLYWKWVWGNKCETIVVFSVQLSGGVGGLPILCVMSSMSSISLFSLYIMSTRCLLFKNK